MPSINKFETFVVMNSLHPDFTIQRDFLYASMREACSTENLENHEGPLVTAISNGDLAARIEYLEGLLDENFIDYDDMEFF